MIQRQRLIVEGLVPSRNEYAVNRKGDSDRTDNTSSKDRSITSDNIIAVESSHFTRTRESAQAFLHGFVGRGFGPNKKGVEDTNDQSEGKTDQAGAMGGGIRFDGMADEILNRA